MHQLPPLLPDEADRLARLRALLILDTDAEPMFDRRRAWPLKPAALRKGC